MTFFLIPITAWIVFSFIVVLIGCLLLRQVNKRLPIPPDERQRNRAILGAITPSPRQGKGYWKDFLAICFMVFLFILAVITL